MLFIFQFFPILDKENRWVSSVLFVATFPFRLTMLKCLWVFFFFLWHRAGSTTNSFAAFISLCSPLFAHWLVLKRSVGEVSLCSSCPLSLLWSLLCAPARLQEAWICTEFLLWTFYWAMCRYVKIHRHKCTCFTAAYRWDFGLCSGKHHIPWLRCKSVCEIGALSRSTHLDAGRRGAFLSVWALTTHAHVTWRCWNLPAFSIYHLLSFLLKSRNEI